MTADELRTLLKLEPNATCGFVRLTYVKRAIAASVEHVDASGAAPR